MKIVTVTMVYATDSILRVNDNDKKWNKVQRKFPVTLE